MDIGDKLNGRLALASIQAQLQTIILRGMLTTRIDVGQHTNPGARMLRLHIL
ncbi:MAG TPA: hypothetical protein VGB73_17285 [Pyrinomonadaceae bacterium]|jgi:hypothetical protein